MTSTTSMTQTDEPYISIYDRVKGRPPRSLLTEEEKTQRKRDIANKYYADHREERCAIQRTYYDNHKEVENAKRLARYYRAKKIKAELLAQ
jgi:hypothetical protein